MLRRAGRKIVAFHRDEKGDLLQTAIIMGILGALAVGALYLLGPKIKTLFENTGGELDSAITQQGGSGANNFTSGGNGGIR
ncbi:MAG: hypothetical protein ACYC2T_08455 [Bacillota bacterium]